MKKWDKRKCSTLLMAGAGAAVCLSGGGKVLAAHGSVSSLNAGQKTFNTTNGYFQVLPAAVGGQVRLSWNPLAGHGILVPAVRYFSSFNPKTRTAFIATHTVAYSAFAQALPLNYDVGPAGLNWNRVAGIEGSLSNTYFALKYPASGTLYVYGWVHVISTSASAKSIQLGEWSYNASGDSIKTLDDSLSTMKLPLSDGRTKLHWTNANEDGVARYEVQAKDASGEWKEVSSDVSGAGQYAATVAKDTEYRLVVEKVDGSTQEVCF